MLYLPPREKILHSAINFGLVERKISLNIFRDYINGRCIVGWSVILVRFNIATSWNEKAVEDTGR
jgi:hypothetical protein